MTIRITESIRSAIVHRLLQHRFEKQAGVLKHKGYELAMKVYRLRYDAKTRQLMESLPDGWMPTTSTMRITLGKTHLDFAAGESLRIPAVDNYVYFDLGKAKGGERIAFDIRAHETSVDAMNKARNELRDKTSNAISNYGSIKRLVDAWPEIKPFTDQLGYDIEMKSLPAVIPADLNKSLGLPVD